MILDHLEVDFPDDESMRFSAWASEIYVSMIQRKVLTANDFPCLEAAAERLANFQRCLESMAPAFKWKFTRADHSALIARMRDRWGPGASP